MLPTALGTSRIEAATPGYRTINRDLRVTGWLVGLLCLLGGIVGGALSYVKTQGKLAMRILTGIFVAYICVWAYVYVGLPKTAAAILHNQTSVFFVAALTSFGGVKGLAKVAQGLL